MAGGKQASVGIVHNFLEYTPRSPDGWSSYYISPICNVMGKIWSNQAMVNYFRDGTFDWDPPFGKSIHHVEQERPGCDWLGINYYGRCLYQLSPMSVFHSSPDFLKTLTRHPCRHLKHLKG